MQTSCFTCLRHTKMCCPVLDRGGEISIDKLLTKYFWFQVEDFNEQQVLCHSCFDQLHAFHQFYLDVERNHQNKGQLYGVDIAVQQTESSLLEAPGDPQELPLAEVKVEPFGFSIQEYTGNEEVNHDKASGSLFVEVKMEGIIEEEVSPNRVKHEKASNDSAKKKERKPPASKVKSTCKSAEEDKIIKRHVQYICESCGLTSTTFTKFQSHGMKNHGSKGSILCCGRHYHSKQRLLAHVQQVENPNLFQCDICQKNFISKHGLRRHKQETHLLDETKIYYCNRCPKRFGIESLLAYHLKGHENLENESIKCAECGKIFPTEPLLKAHMKIRHTRPINYVCDVCAKGFIYEAHLRTHKKEHETVPADQRTQCDVCNQWFKNKASWKKHYKRHKQAPVECDLCGHISPNKALLIDHKRHQHREAERAALEPNHVCRECGKEFKRAVTLKEHMACHTGQALYKCTYCDRMFNSNANMFAHRKKMHPKEWFERKQRRLAGQIRLPPSEQGSVEENSNE